MTDQRGEQEHGQHEQHEVHDRDRPESAQPSERADAFQKQKSQAMRDADVANGEAP